MERLVGSESHLDGRTLSDRHGWLFGILQECTSVTVIASVSPG